MSPGEFAHLVRASVEKEGVRVVIIDSLNGYMNAMPEEKFLTAQLHELLSFLAQRGVQTLMTVAQAGIVGTYMQSPIDTTYLADNVLLFRYFELNGQMHRAISVTKKRSGPHERSIREILIGSNGLEIGPPLDDLHGILAGAAHRIGIGDSAVADLMRGRINAR
jgi:circadian clock protein KaiC